MHVQKLSEKFDFINQFNGVVTSNIAKAYKPNIEIFNYACVIAKIKPCEAVFIDDSEENIKSAFNLGMTTHQYKSYKSFLDFIDNLLIYNS